MEDALEILSLPGLAICIVIGTIILSRLDARAHRRIVEAGKAQGGVLPAAPRRPWN
jgi:hypothetical protein